MLSPKLLFFFFGTIIGILSTLILIPEVQTHAYSASNRLSGFLHGGGGEEEERSGSAWKPPEFDVGDYGGVPVGTESVVCTRREKELLRGKVGDKLVDRLQPHLFYLTAGSGAGLTNQVFAFFNLIYLSLLTSRIPILAPFHANNQVPSQTHLQELNPSSYFDLPHFLASVPLAQGIVEWSEIYPDLLGTGPDGERFRDSEEEKREWEETGCWGEFVKGESLRAARIKPTWTPYPPLVKSPTDRLISFLHFVPYLLPNSPFAASLFSPSSPSSSSSSSASFLPTLPPNNSFACLDETMAGSDLGTEPPMEMIGFGRGSWKAVGSHLRFRPELEEEGRGVAGRIFGFVDGVEQRVKPFITVHIRHGDFLSFQCNPDPTKPCWSIPQFHRSLTLLQADLVAAGREEVKDVLVMTDETDEKFLSEVKNLGWKVPGDGKVAGGSEEEVKLKEELGGWYDTLLDTVLLSQGAHIVGTAGSTMSVLSVRRVVDWNNGYGRLVGAEDAS